MKTLVVAKVVLVNGDGDILLLRRSKADSRRPEEYDIPGGHTDGDEFVNEAAARETLEESGITIDPRTLKLVYSETKIVDSELNVTWVVFLGHTSDTHVSLSTEHSEHKWVSLRDAIDLIDYDRQKRILSHINDTGLLNV